MRHRKSGRKLGRSGAHRSALLRNLVTSLLDHERIQTTDAKAKELRRIADRMITLGKRGDLHARRQALRVIRTREVTAKVFDDLAERFRERPGGYTRVLKLRTRVGDAAPVSLVELVAAEPTAGEAGGKAEPTRRRRRAAPAAEGAAKAKGAARSEKRPGGGRGAAEEPAKRRTRSRSAKGVEPEPAATPRRKRPSSRKSS